MKIQSVIVTILVASVAIWITRLQPLQPWLTLSSPPPSSQPQCTHREEDDPFGLATHSLFLQMQNASQDDIALLMHQTRIQHSELVKKVYEPVISNYPNDPKYWDEVLDSGSIFRNHAHLFQPFPNVKNQHVLERIQSSIRQWNATAFIDIEEVKRSIDRQITHESLAIENIVVPIHKIETMLKTPNEPIVVSASDVIHVLGHSKAQTWLKQFADRPRQNLTVHDIKQAHAMVLGSYFPSSFRANHVRVLSSAIIFPSPDEVPALMDQFMEWYHTLNCSNVNAIECAAAVHYNFVRIHPFDDGNGRMSRLLMNLELQRQYMPPSNIEACDRHVYFTCLEKIQESGDFEPFYDLIGRRMLSVLNFSLALQRPTGQI